MRGTTRASGVGSVLGQRYELVRRIAAGAMGEVFEAEDWQLQRRVAVKFIGGATAEDRARFDAEVGVLAALKHPALVSVYDAGEQDGHAFVVLELIDGDSLHEVLAERGSLPPREVASLGAAIADVLVYVHQRGVVHRDVTPANVLCARDGRPRLADFGVARLVDRTRATATGTALGTAYLAPEQVEGHDVTPAADVYALGLVLLELLIGRQAFEGSAEEVAVTRLVRSPDTRGLPAGWIHLLDAMTARPPSNRPSAAAVRSRLVALANASGEATGPAVPLGRLKHRHRAEGQRTRSPARRGLIRLRSRASR